MTLEESNQRLTISRVPSGSSNQETLWAELVAHTEQADSDLIVLPEMSFYKWVPASEHVDDSEWRAAVKAHNNWIDRLDALAPATVISSRPIIRDGTRLNEGFVWDADSGYQVAHHKAYLPDEKGFWEATWYEPGPGEFASIEAGDIEIGFLICTELWAMEQVRTYGRAGVDLIVTPRATEATTREKWFAAGQTAAVASGAFSVSANRSPTAHDTPAFGGQSWCIHPDGDILATTNETDPFATVTINIAQPTHAQNTYPRYALEWHFSVVDNRRHLKMPGMTRELEADPDSGLLGYQ